VSSVSEVRQRGIYTAEALVPGPTHLAIEIVIAKLKCKLPGGDEMSAELSQAGSETWSEVHKFINCLE
jgi:hypothetical protein